MSRNRGRRLDKLERIIAPGRIVCVLDCDWNHWLIETGFIPSDDEVPEQDRPASAKPRRRLQKRDIVVFLSEAEMAV